MSEVQRLGFVSTLPPNIRTSPPLRSNVSGDTTVMLVHRPLRSHEGDLSLHDGLWLPEQVLGREGAHAGKGRTRLWGRFIFPSRRGAYHPSECPPLSPCGGVLGGLVGPGQLHPYPVRGPTWPPSCPGRVTGRKLRPQRESAVACGMRRSRARGAMGLATPLRLIPADASNGVR